MTTIANLSLDQYELSHTPTASAEAHHWPKFWRYMPKLDTTVREVVGTRKLLVLADFTHDHWVKPLTPLLPQRSLGRMLDRAQRLPLDIRPPPSRPMPNTRYGALATNPPEGGG